MPQISSFDIFDTVLTRLVIDPTDIFKICGDRALNFGWLEISAESFRQLRVNAEQRSRLFYEGGEVSLDEIYRELANSLEIPIEIIDKLKELELTVESEYLVAVPQADDLMTEARRSHSQILFLSDMYLPQEFLESQLKNMAFGKKAIAYLCRDNGGSLRGMAIYFYKLCQNWG